MVKEVVERVKVVVVMAEEVVERVKVVVLMVDRTGGFAGSQSRPALRS